MKKEKEEVIFCQLATRIPKELHRRLKLYCIGTESSVMSFVIAALETKLGRAKTKLKSVK